MTNPLYFYWTSQHPTLFAATHDDTGEGLPAHLQPWNLLTPFAVEKACKLDNFPREKANADIEKLGYFLFNAKLTFLDPRPVD
jgi:hypothetical protein